ncbi:unnamed protein product, partial [Mesorhabditis spiculigera]
MASAGVLPFVKGIDFSRNDFANEKFPQELEACTQMTWLKLNNTSLERVPDVLSRMTKLEHLQMSKNSLTSVHGELSDLPRLRSIIVRHNTIKTSGIPTDIFRMKDLTIIDFSHNHLREVPPNLEYAKGAIVLNLSHNKIENVPNQVFTNLIDLIHLDLSDNKIDMLPPQLRRLLLLQVLHLSNNPLSHFQLKQLPCTKNLRVLHMSNTNRTLQNLPDTFDDLENLMDVSFAQNDLPEVPRGLYQLKKLRKLNLSGNKLKKLEIPEGCWEGLVTLNVSSNELTSLPEGIVRMDQLQRLYANNNELTFDGFPGGIGKLIQLTVLHLSNNRLELVPEGLSRCVKLQRLRLDHNRLITLPDGIHLLPDLSELRLNGNEGLVMPPKPSEKRRRLAFYNIDFSLQGQLKMAGRLQTLMNTATAASSSGSPIQRRKDFIRRRRHQADENCADKLIKGMSKSAGATAEFLDRGDDDSASSPGIPGWKAAMGKERQKIDYSEFFDADVGKTEGMWMWEIDKFHPAAIEPEFHGYFYEGDCYIVLNVTMDANGKFEYEIFYWLGEKTTQDRRMCAAMHSVALSQHLGVSCRTQREEQNEESDEFLSLYGDEIIYLDGARTTSGFFTVEQKVHVTRLYRVSVSGINIEMEPVPPSSDSLDPRYAFLLDAEKRIWIWSGSRSQLTVTTKARLFAERMNKRDRKGAAEIETCHQRRTPEEFWMDLTGSPNAPDEPIFEHVPDDLSRNPKLYKTVISAGFIELPQIELEHGIAKQEMLQSKGCYILDCGTDVYSWTGKKAGRLLKMAGQRLLNDIFRMITRPDYAQMQRENEGEETSFFKLNFAHWDDIVPVDYTRTPESIEKRGPDVKVIMERDQLKTDLTHLFMERNDLMSKADGEKLIRDFNTGFEMIEVFNLNGKQFAAQPKSELGIFYSGESYVFLCKYTIFGDDDSDVDDEESVVATDSNQNEEKKVAVDFKCMVYFWQGRDASNMDWLHFTFGLRPKLEQLFKDKMEVVRIYQQRENHWFLSHFNHKILIFTGKRSQREKADAQPELFQMRANGSNVSTRTIQIPTKAKNLCSGFCHLLRVPACDKWDGCVFIWAGKTAPEDDVVLAQEIAESMLADGEEVVSVKEGDEPELFWDALGGKHKYVTDPSFMQYTRLFRCSNDKGYFSVTEKTIDFCQDDLEDDDVMILDNGTYIFLWLGPKASDVEIKLSYKAIHVYEAHLRLKQPERPRKVVATAKGHETNKFTRCFHAWGAYKKVAE